MSTERAKFLTEAMGGCWHEWKEDLDEYTDFTSIADEDWENGAQIAAICREVINA